MSTLVRATCLCGHVNEAIEIPSPLPINSITCSCDTCRYCTGVLFLTCLPLTQKPVAVDSLKRYSSSERLTRYFCGQCGSHFCCRQENDGSWSLCAGVVDEVVGLEQHPSQLQAFTQHEFVGDALDGGLAVCLASLESDTVPVFLQGPEGKPLSVLPQRVPRSSTARMQRPPSRLGPGPAGKILRGSCHCGGVQFDVTRPNEASKKCSSPWPDLLVPHSAHSENPKDVKWWLCNEDTLYFAGTCACRSCRLATGSPIQTWAFVPKVNLQKTDGSRFDFNLGTLRQHVSSKHTYREFCSTCGATIFWHCEERPDLIDVSVGVLRAPEGSMAEQWLKWCTERLSFKEDAFDKTMADQFEMGLRALADALS